MSLDPEIIDRLSAYLDGAASPAEKASVENLLAGNPEARKALEDLRAVSRRVKDLPLLTPPEAFYRRVLRDIDAPVRRPFLSYFPLKTAGALLAAALVMVAGNDHWRAWLRREEPAPSPLQMMQAPARAQVALRKEDDRAAFFKAEPPRPEALKQNLPLAIGARDKDARLSEKEEAPAPPAPSEAADALSSVAPAQAKTAATFGAVGGGPEAAPVMDEMPAKKSRASASRAMARRPAMPMAAPAAAGFAVTNEETGQTSYGPGREWRGDDSAVQEPLSLAAHTPEEWSALWARHAPGRTAPVVDFNRWSAVAVFAGAKPSAGYAVVLTVASEADGVTVATRTIPPSAGAFTAQVVTTPYLIRLIPRAGRIKFTSK